MQDKCTTKPSQVFERTNDRPLGEVLEIELGLFEKALGDAISAERCTVVFNERVRPWILLNEGSKTSDAFAGKLIVWSGWALLLFGAVAGFILGRVL